MAITLADGLRSLRDATERAKSISVPLDDRYLRAIALVESLPQNQSGADKTWVLRLAESSSKHLASAIRIG